MKLTAWDRMTLALFPRWTLNRVRARMGIEIAARHYEAAMPGRRTEGWTRNTGDADQATRGAALELRIHARDLIRNNGFARRAQRVVANNTVGWGIAAQATGPNAARAQELWKAWAGSTECETDGRATFTGIQNLVMKAIVSDGEVFVRRRRRFAADGLTIPIQLQVLEADHLAAGVNDNTSIAGGPIIQGIEFDKLGRRAAYWLYPQHPGSGRNFEVAKRIPADQIAHVLYTERPGQTRGVSWLGAAIVPLKDFDEYEDASLVRQKIAAMFAGFVTDLDGAGGALGLPSTDADNPLGETFEPGTLQKLPAGKTIVFPSPPTANDTSTQVQTLRKVAAAIGITYEDLSNDFSQVNFSSARMARIAHWANVYDWREHMLIPLLCERVFSWAMEAAQLAGELPEGDLPGSTWIAPPMPMIEPDKEGLAYQRLIRTGGMTPSDMVRELGLDPATHWAAYAADMKNLDALGIILDSDARKTSAAGLEQPSVTQENAPAPAPPKKPIP